MLGIDTKLSGLTDKISQLRTQYAGQTTVLAELDAVEAQIENAADEARGIVTDTVSQIDRIASVQCVAGQLPIPDVAAAFDAVTANIEALGAGVWMQFDSYLDALLAGLSETEAVQKLTELKTKIAQKLTAVTSVSDAMTVFGELQTTITSAMGVIGAMVGCVAGIMDSLSAVGGVVTEIKPIVAQATTALSEAQAVYDDPMGILAEARNRVTAAADLDGRMAAVKTDLEQALGALL